MDVGDTAFRPQPPDNRRPPRPNDGTGAAVGFALLLGLVATAAGAKAVLHDTLDPDCFWHLRVAAQLETDGIGPLTDRLSFASVQEAWSPYAWLAELAMKQVWDRGGGYRAAVAAQAVLQILFVLAVALGCRAARRADEPRSRWIPSPRAGHDADHPSLVSSLVATALAGAMSLPYLGFRPSTACLLVLAACAWLLVRDRARREQTRAVWLVIPLTVLAVNLHLVALAVPLWALALLIGSVWERCVVARPAERREADRRCARCFVLLCGTGFACLCTPMLPGMIEAVLHFQFADPMVRFGFSHTAAVAVRGELGFRITLGALVVAGLILIVNRRRLRAGEVLWLACGAALVVRMDRFVPLLAMSAAPMLAVVLPRLPDRPLTLPLVRVGLAGCLAVAMFGVARGFPSHGHPMEQWVNRRGPDAPGYPTEAARFVATSLRPETGRLISEIDWGGYLEWRLGDRYQLLLDGRTHLFTPEFWRATYLAAPDRRRAFLEQVDADAAVLPARRSVFREPLAHLGWRTAYADDRAVVMVPPGKDGEKEQSWTVVSALESQ